MTAQYREALRRLREAEQRGDSEVALAFYRFAVAFYAPLAARS